MRTLFRPPRCLYCGDESPDHVRAVRHNGWCGNAAVYSKPNGVGSEEMMDIETKIAWKRAIESLKEGGVTDEQIRKAEEKLAIWYSEKNPRSRF